MDIRALYTTKPPKWAHTCQGDLAADPDVFLSGALPHLKLPKKRYPGLVMLGVAENVVRPQKNSTSPIWGFEHSPCWAWAWASYGNFTVTRSRPELSSLVSYGRAIATLEATEPSF
jgi:hypothetical protein